MTDVELKINISLADQTDGHLNVKLLKSIKTLGHIKTCEEEKTRINIRIENHREAKAENNPNFNDTNITGVTSGKRKREFLNTTVKNSKVGFFYQPTRGGGRFFPYHPH